MSVFELDNVVQHNQITMDLLRERLIGPDRQFSGFNVHVCYR